MKLLTGGNAVQFFPKGSAVTIGNFDGVHRGHQALLNSLKKEADSLDLPVVAILFEPQPLEFLNPQQQHPRLQTLREKIIALSTLGVDYVYRLKFNAQLATTSAADFVQYTLQRQLNTKILMIGQDFHFGYHRQGDLSLLQEMAKEKGCMVFTFKDYLDDETRISSTKVRHLLQEGNLKQVKSLLGRDYSICGRVIKGQGLGATWQIPTANILLNRPPLPLKGVFLVQVKRQSGALLKGIANLGLRPTVNGTTLTLEIHLFDFNEKIYGQRLHVYFLDKLREECKFSSLDLLIAQINRDILAAKAWFDKENMV